MKTCSDCKKRPTCKEPCVFVEEMLQEVEVEDWRMLYCADVREEACYKKNGIYRTTTRAAAFMDHGVTEKAMREEILLLKRMFRPLCALDARTRLIFIEANYFGTPKHAIAKAFKIRRRGVYEFLKKAEEGMGRIQACKTVSEPGGEAGECCGHQDTDMPEVAL